MAIQSFADELTEEFFITGKVKPKAGWGGVAKVAMRKLDILHYAVKLRDLREPPANRLEALKGKLVGRYSIRINDQWRIIFRWTDAGPIEVEIVDYH